MINVEFWMMNIGAKRREGGRAHAEGAKGAEGKGKPRMGEDGRGCFCCDVTRRSKVGGLARWEGEAAGGRDV